MDEDKEPISMTEAIDVDSDPRGAGRTFGKTGTSIESTMTMDPASLQDT